METKTFFTSDTHFNHANIIKYSNRPFSSVEEMNRKLIENWNNTVKPFDTVFHLGDFAMGPPARWADFRKALNGKIILILGNHDKNAKFMRDEVGFDEVYESFEWNGWKLHHKPYKTNEKLLHGHVHTHWRKLGKFIVNLSVDVWDFKPVTIEEIEAAPSDSWTYKCQFCNAELKHLEDNQAHSNGYCITGNMIPK